MLKSKKKVDMSKKYTKKNSNYLSLTNMYIHYSKDYCQEPCVPNQDMSKQFYDIQKNIDDIIKNLKQKPLLKMFDNLAQGDSISFYKNKIKGFQDNVKIPNHQDILRLRRTIKKINRFCICIGASEVLAPFGIYLSDVIKNQKKNDIISTVKDVGFLVSSMRKDFWNPELNQEIIIDTLLDKPNVNKEAWGLTNSMLGLLMIEPIHYKKNNKHILDLEKVFSIVKCRVIRHEICLIYTILNKFHNEYAIKFGKITSDFWVYFIYRKN